jgi:hypothetical protein
MWDLQQQARTIASQRITPACATMHEVQENLNALSHDVVGGVTLETRNETYSTGIMLKSWIVQS